MGEPATNPAPGIPQTPTLDGMLGRWPTIICDGCLRPSRPFRCACRVRGGLALQGNSLVLLTAAFFDPE